MTRDYYPVITSVKHIDEDTVEIKRAIIYKRFFNGLPYPEETIRIDRSKIGKKPLDVVLDSYTDFGFKKEMTRLYSYGYLLKRQLIDIDSHKAF